MTDFYSHVIRLLPEALRHATMIEDKGHLPTISAFDFLSYCFLRGIKSLVMSQYENLTYGPHITDGQRHTGGGQGLY